MYSESLRSFSKIWHFYFKSTPHVWRETNSPPKSRRPIPGRLDITWTGWSSDSSREVMCHWYVEILTTAASALRRPPSARTSSKQTTPKVCGPIEVHSVFFSIERFFLYRTILCFFLLNMTTYRKPRSTLTNSSSCQNDLQKVCILKIIDDHYAVYE